MKMAAQIVYCGVFESGELWASVLKEGDNVANLAQALVDKIDCGLDHRKAFSPYQGYVFQYIVEDGVCFMGAAHADMPLHVTFAFLDRIKNEYRGTYAGSSRVREFKALVEKEIDFFSNNPEADKLRGLKQKVNDVTGVMKGNIEKVLDRGEKLEDLEERTDELTSHAQLFHQKSKNLRCQMCLNNYKMMGVFAIVILAVIILLVIFLWANGVFDSSEDTDNNNNGNRTIVDASYPLASMIGRHLPFTRK